MIAVLGQASLAAPGSTAALGHLEVYRCSMCMRLEHSFHSGCTPEHINGLISK